MWWFKKFEIFMSWSSASKKIENSGKVHVLQKSDLSLSYLLRWYCHPRGVSLGAWGLECHPLNLEIWHLHCVARNLTVRSWVASEKETRWHWNFVIYINWSTLRYNNNNNFIIEKLELKLNFLGSQKRILFLEQEISLWPIWLKVYSVH